MLFNSIHFAIFLPIVFFIYWFIVNQKLHYQNFLLLVASYVFYAFWDWRFLFLLVFSTYLDYFTGLKISENGNATLKKFWFWLSISINIGFLGLFKYYNFFVSSFADVLLSLGFSPSLQTLNIVLPIGISFYTFHGLSYVIDIYNDKIKAERNFIDYSLFVSFFPLLVAGPIERATHLLPQIKKSRTFNYNHAVDGLRQILYGLFKKVVIADQCAVIVNTIFSNYLDYSGSTLLLGAILFTFQIYCDFSGYSDIALGVARLFGFELLRNFAFPYFSRDIAEFWRRWHISLSTWFRDYLYIPLGGSKVGTALKIRNVFIIFLISGFWHGANWTFIIWGFLNALYIIPSIIFKTNRNNIDTVAQGKYLPSFKEFAAISLTFGLTVVAWVFFRSESVHQAFTYLNKMFSLSLFSVPQIKPSALFACLCFFIVIEWFGRESKHALESFGNTWPRLARWSFYYVLIVLTISFSGFEQEFIYFQF